MFISAGLQKPYFIGDEIILKHLSKFCELNKIKLYYLYKDLPGHPSAKMLNYLPKGNWEYIGFKNKKKLYEMMNKQQLIVFTHSTLGFEAMTKGIKCLRIVKDLPIHPKTGRVFPIKGYYKKYGKSGEFWINSLKFSDINKYLNKIVNCPYSKWKKIIKLYSKEILSYDPHNYKIKKLIKNILNNKKQIVRLSEDLSL